MGVSQFKSGGLQDPDYRHVTVSTVGLFRFPWVPTWEGSPFHSTVVRPDRWYQRRCLSLLLGHYLRVVNCLYGTNSVKVHCLKCLKSLVSWHVMNKLPFRYEYLDRTRYMLSVEETPVLLVFSWYVVPGSRYVVLGMPERVKYESKRFKCVWLNSSVKCYPKSVSVPLIGNNEFYTLPYLEQILINDSISLSEVNT